MSQELLFHISGREEAQRLKQLAQQGPKSSGGLGAAAHHQVRGSSGGHGRQCFKQVEPHRKFVPNSA
jgi:hypothetical protein